jgi:ketosteroid isomerase-like protein
MSSFSSDVDFSNPDVAAIVQIANDFCEAWKTGNLAVIMDAYSADVIKSNQGSPNCGKKELEQRYAKAMAQFQFEISVQIEEAEIISDSMAYDRATFTTRATPKAGGQTVVTKGRLLEVLKKENGKWKSFRVMGTLD